MNYQTALITGATSGIGKATAEVLTKRGMRLVLMVVLFLKTCKTA